MSLLWLLPLASCLVALVCGVLIIGFAHKWKLMDKPNHRSSHKVPTPSGGGIGLVIAGTLSGVYLVWQSRWGFGAVVLVLSCLLAGVGLKDDRQPLPALLRLGIQAAMGVSLLFILGGMTELQRFSDAWLSRSLIYVFLMVVIVWWLNLFNFMDGIDGMAGSQVIFMLSAATGLLIWIRPDILFSPALIWMFCIAGACFGFLILNWAPARIFMGDVGSIYLAFMVLALGLLSIRNSWIDVGAGVAMWVVLGGLFVTDATVTLITRVLGGKRWHEAHRSHVYQRLARKFGQHRLVTLSYMAVNILWLLPLAAACVAWPGLALVFACVAYLPLIAGAIALGAGKADGPNDD